MQRKEKLIFSDIYENFYFVGIEIKEYKLIMKLITKVVSHLVLKVY